ncbi:transporter substrate-binding domain-containing protein [Actinomadura formosensis]|uniref:transporter substrate-binding domain-containing protein n=1 Tax=Actinomadura formosensis TaxID=60706 RepID=UPI003D8D13B7
MVEVRARRTAAAAAALTMLGPAAACGLADAGETSVATKDRLVIGVNADQPGVGEREGDGPYKGFDIDVAKAIAGRLGVAGKNVAFKRVYSATREKMLQEGEVDLVVASYSVTPERKVKVAFAGPYYVAHQDVLVRASDAGKIRSIHDLKGRRLCKVRGSVSFPRIHDEQGVAALPVEEDGYSACLTDLVENRLDAVSTDDLILAGLAGKAAANGRKLTIVNASFTDEPYGVGIRRSDVDGCEAVNKAITGLYQDGTMPQLLKRWFGNTGLKLTTTVPQFEGCV